MTIAEGQKLPAAHLHRMGDAGPEQVAVADLTAGRKVVIFGVIGAFTGTCDTEHLPTFIRTRQAFADKGVDEIICVSVNDPFVMAAWDKATGASDGGVTLMGDPGAEFTRAIGMEFSAAVVGFHDRSQRYAMLVEDGVVTKLVQEPTTFDCAISTGTEFIELI